MRYERGVIQSCVLNCLKVVRAENIPRNSNFSFLFREPHSMPRASKELPNDHFHCEIKISHCKQVSFLQSAEEKTSIHQI